MRIGSGLIFFDHIVPLHILDHKSLLCFFVGEIPIFLYLRIFCLRWNGLFCDRIFQHHFYHRWEFRLTPNQLIRFEPFFSAKIILSSIFDLHPFSCVHFRKTLALLVPGTAWSALTTILRLPLSIITDHGSVLLRGVGVDGSDQVP